MSAQGHQEINPADWPLRHPVPVWSLLLRLSQLIRTICRGFRLAAAARLLGLSVALPVVSMFLAEDAVGASSASPSTIDIPNYVFEHEEAKIRSWQTDAIGVRSFALAYLILEPDQDGKSRRSLVLVDDIDHPTMGYFLAGPTLVPVPRTAEKPLSERIDRSFSFAATAIDAFGSLTVNIVDGNMQKEKIKLEFARALSSFHEKFEKYPCLTLPDVMTLSSGAQSVEFAVLLRNEKTVPGFDPSCGINANNLVAPKFLYVTPAGLTLAFTRSRLVFIFKNRVVSIPFDLDERAVEYSDLLILKAQLQKILADFENREEILNALVKGRGDEVKLKASMVQLRIDLAITGRPVLFNSASSPDGVWVAENFGYDGCCSGGAVFVHKTSEPANPLSDPLVRFPSTAPQLFLIWQDNKTLSLVQDSDAGPITGPSMYRGISVAYSTYRSGRDDNNAFDLAASSKEYLRLKEDVSAEVAEEATETGRRCWLSISAVDGAVYDRIGMRLEASINRCKQLRDCAGISSEFWVGKRIDGRYGVALTSATASNISSTSRGPSGHNNNTVVGQFNGGSAVDLMRALNPDALDTRYSFNFFDAIVSYRIPTKGIAASITSFKACVGQAGFN